MRRVTRLMAGTSCGAVRGGAAFHRVVQDDVVVVADLGLVPEPRRDGPVRPLRIGRASGSYRLTSRVAPSGICPASRVRTWVTIVAVRSRVTASSVSARRSRPRIRPLRACGTARRPLRSTAAAWAAAVSARPANSPVTRLISAERPALASFPLLRRLLAIWRTSGQQHAAGPSSPRRR